MRFLALRVCGSLAFVLGIGCASDCDDLKSQAAQLKNELGACSAGDTCVTVTVDNDCVGGALACGFAVPSTKSVEARSRAQAIADESRDCNPCAQAECANPGQPTCNTPMGRCVFPRSLRRMS